MKLPFELFATLLASRPGEFVIAVCFGRSERNQRNRLNQAKRETKTSFGTAMISGKVRMAGDIIRMGRLQHELVAFH